MAPRSSAGTNNPLFIQEKCGSATLRGNIIRGRPGATTSKIEPLDVSIISKNYVIQEPQVRYPKLCALGTQKPFQPTYFPILRSRCDGLRRTAHRAAGASP